MQTAYHEEAKAALPQTGEKDNVAGFVGILASVLGLFGLSIKRKNN